MKKIIFVGAFISLTMLVVSSGIFAQEVTIDSWGYGLETSFGLVPGYEIPNSYSLSFQGHHRQGSGWSIDWISRQIKFLDEYHGDYYEESMTKNGLLGSLFLGFPIGNIFRPYIGGGLGFGFVGLFGDISFAWKLDAGVVAWLSDTFYLKTGYTYDNIREHSISVGIGLRFQKEVTSPYYVYTQPSTQSSINTATVTSQYSIGLASSYSPVPISDQIDDIVYLEVSKLRQDFTVTPISSDEWNKNTWLDYIVKLALYNRTWYSKDIGYVYRTNLMSNTGKKYIVFTCIRKGNYYTDTLELTSYDYTRDAYEIN